MSEKAKGTPWKAVGLALALFMGVGLFIGGVVFGIWFTQNFQVVPRGDFNEMVSQALGDSASLDDLIGRATKGQSLDVGGLVEQALATEHSGPFTFKFKQGEQLQYRMIANVNGRGLDFFGDEPVSLGMDSGFKLVTRSVDRQGNGTVELSFGNTQMAGDFMGSSMELKQGPNGALFMLNGQPMVDTARQLGSTAAIPQLDFFNKTLRMQVAPNGEVTDLSGGGDGAPPIASLPLLTDLEFPQGDLAEGAQWETGMAMNIPGFGQAVNVRIMNTFAGYKTIGNRFCAVIQQTLTSEQVQQGTLVSPQSALGPDMSFSMPGFSLEGGNTVYFDTENGQVVHSEMGLDLNLDIGKALGPTGQILEGLGANLRDLLSDLPEFEDMGRKAEGKPGDPPKNLLSLDLGIDATVSLIDPLSP